VTALFSDPRLSADRMKGFVDAAPEAVREPLRTVAPYLETWLIMADGDDHKRLRTGLHHGFNAAAVRDLSGVIEGIADELLDRVADGGRMDFAEDFAFLLPAYVLCEFMGVPAEDRDRIVRWSVDFVDFFNVVPINEDTTTRMVRSTIEMRDYTRDLLADAAPDTFLGTLKTEGGMSDDEILGNAMLLLVAGHYAPRNLMGNLVWLLAEHPDERSKLRDDPGLIDAAIDETLRFEPPVILIPRISLEEIEVRGQVIPAGKVVQLSIAAANRDPEKFPDPDRFDVERRPKGVLAFGHGPHGCLGAPLARAETRIALSAFLRRMPDYELDGEIRWYRNAGNRGPESMPVRF
jgi:cytochrome P450